MKFSSPAALQFVKMTTSSAACDENFIKITTLLFQWNLTIVVVLLVNIAIGGHVVLLCIHYYTRIASLWHYRVRPGCGQRATILGRLIWLICTMTPAIKTPTYTTIWKFIFRIWIRVCHGFGEITCSHTKVRDSRVLRRLSFHDDGLLNGLFVVAIAVQRSRHDTLAETRFFKFLFTALSYSFSREGAFHSRGHQCSMMCMCLTFLRDVNFRSRRFRARAIRRWVTRKLVCRLGVVGVPAATTRTLCCSSAVIRISPYRRCFHGPVQIPVNIQCISPRRVTLTSWCHISTIRAAISWIILIVSVIFISASIIQIPLCSVGIHVHAVTI